MYLISPVYARLLLRELTGAGVSPEALLANTGLGMDMSTSENVSRDSFLTLLDNAARLAPQENIGLLLGQHSGVAGLGAVGGAMLAAPRVREGLQLLQSYARLHAGYLRVNLIPVPQGLSVRLKFIEPVGGSERYHEEVMALVLQDYIRQVAGSHTQQIRYYFDFDPGSRQEAYLEHLKGNVCFNSQHSSVDLPTGILSVSSPYHDSGIWSEMQQNLVKRLAKQGESVDAVFTEHVLEILRSSELPLPHLRQVAQSLHMSDRSLNRKLQKEKNSYRELRVRAIIERAKLYLGDSTLTIEAIATMLGYQDTANFHRAFRRVTGCSPGKFRRN